jgi:hypothetical protein
MMNHATYNRGSPSESDAAHGSDLSNAPLRGEPLERQDSARSTSSIMQLAQRQHEEFLVARRRRQLPSTEEPPAPPVPPSYRLPLREDPAIQLPGVSPRTSKRFPTRLDLPSRPSSEPNGKGHVSDSEEASRAADGSTKQAPAPRQRPVDVQWTEPDDPEQSSPGAAANMMRIACDKCGDVVRVGKFAVVFQCPHCSTLNYAGSELVSPVPRAGAATLPPSKAAQQSLARESSVSGVSI